MELEHGTDIRCHKCIRRNRIMIFSVQASNPKYWKNVLDEEDSSLSDAIETIFPLNTEYAFLEWNHIFIPLSYK